MQCVQENKAEKGNSCAEVFSLNGVVMELWQVVEFDWNWKGGRVNGHRRGRDVLGGGTQVPRP